MAESGKKVITFARAVFYAVTNLLLFAAGSVMLWLGVWAAVAARTSDAAAYLAAGLVLLFAATISRFESLKGLGVEAKTKIDQQINETDTRLKLLKEATEMFATQIVELNSSVGRWDSTPKVRAAYDNAQKIKLLLEEGGSDATTIRRVLLPWVRVTCFDLCIGIYQELNMLLASEVSRKRAALSEISPQADNDQASATRNALAGEIKAIEVYKEHLAKKLNEFSGSDFAQKFVPLLQEAPPLATNIDHLVTHAEKLKGVITELNEKLYLRDPSLLVDVN